MFIYEFTALLRKNASRQTKNIIQSCRIVMDDRIVGLGSQTEFCCMHGHKLTVSLDLTHPDSNGKGTMDYEANLKSIMQGSMNGVAGSILDTAGVLLDFPHARNLSRSFSRNQELVGKKIRAIVLEAMDLAL